MVDRTNTFVRTNALTDLGTVVKRTICVTKDAMSKLQKIRKFEDHLFLFSRLLAAPQHFQYILGMLYSHWLWDPYLGVSTDIISGLRVVGALGQPALDERTVGGRMRGRAALEAPLRAAAPAGHAASAQPLALHHHLETRKICNDEFTD